MNFALSEEQEFFKKTIADTVDKMIVPKAQEIDEKDEFPLSFGGNLPDLDTSGFVILKKLAE